ncbi:proton-coupled folate transporter-like isoform X2 [Odontomachus brunneus]|uniref:proton-coupled folate transporter-like isoform X2 n=1 Tax=Odontomachus brunneus TaxID=486640 RepID=UPI0013F2873F|nr:proton-coupled folate transporter-like isoform X2 [Odontomachus brunneus]
MDQTGWRRFIMVQPPVVLLLLAQSMSGTILTDLIVYRTCTMTLKINQTECLILHNNSSSPEALKINLQVQPYASLILMSKSFIESIFPSFLSLFLGPWSDKHGRKPVILSGYIGISLTYLLLSIMTHWNIAPWYLLLAYVPTALSGGLCVLILASLCYITDITNDSERSGHLAWLDALISLGLLIGLFSGPAVFEAYGYIAVFSIATILCIVATLYILLCVPETIQSHSTGTICKIFDFVLVKDLVRTCVEKRDGFNRSLVWSCIVCLTLLLITLQGEMTIGYLFASARLGWDVQEYSTYVGASVVLGILGTILGIKLMRQCAGLPEAIIAIISVTSSLGSALMRAFIWQSWHMYLSTSIGMFSDLARPMIRAILSKTVPVQDTGKIFSLTQSLETLLPFAAASLYTLLYSHYMPPVYPVPVWFLAAAFYIITIILLTHIQIEMIRRNNTCYVSLIDNNDSDH